MKHYSYGFIFSFVLPKHWFWFSDPYDIENAAMVNFFSYNKIDKNGFFRRDGITSVIDLTQNLDVIWSKMREGFVRDQIQKGERRGIEIKRDNNFKDFKKIYEEFREAKLLPKDNFNVFEKQGLLFNAYYQGSVIASGLFISDGESIRAWVLASLHYSNDGKMRETVGQANRILIWEAIKYARETGHKIFDLGGTGIQSLAQFKEGFGGDRRECYYYYKVYSPLLKLWMRLRGFKNI